MNKTKKRKLKKTAACALGFGLIASVTAFFTMALIGALICGSFPDPTAKLGAVAFAVLMLSGAISGFSTSRFKGSGGILPAFLSSLIFATVCLLIGLIMTSGKLPMVVCVNLLLYMAVSLFFAFLGRPREKKHKRR